jgi:NitT/TauT family transport system permease protein
LKDISPSRDASTREMPASTALWLRSKSPVLIPFVLILAAWSAISGSGLVDPIFLPSPLKTLASFRDLLTINFLRENLIPSVLRVAAAFALSAIVAIPVGVLSGFFPSAGRFILPLCNFTRYLPVPALVPLCILWFGIDDAQKIAVITLGSVFQLLALIAADTASIPQDLVEAARTLGLSEGAVLRRVVLWWALPAIWDDLRVCAGWAWSYLVLAELVAGNRGLGYFVIQSQRYLYTDRVFAAIVLIGLVGLLADRMFKLAGPRLFPWV